MLRAPLIAKYCIKYSSQNADLFYLPHFSLLFNKHDWDQFQDRSNWFNSLKRANAKTTQSYFLCSASFNIILLFLDLWWKYQSKIHTHLGTALLLRPPRIHVHTHLRVASPPGGLVRRHNIFCNKWLVKGKF